MTEDKPKFSLLNAARSQNAPAKAPVPAAPSKPIQQSTAVPAPKAGLLSGGKSLLGGGSKTVAQPKTEVVGTPIVGVSGDSKSLLSAAKSGGLAGSLEKAKAQQELSKQTHDRLFTEPPKDFQALLDEFDKFFAADTGISEFDLAPARDFVERIFNDLRTDPNLDGLMKDRDVGNVIEWVSKVKGEALAAGNLKKEKAEAKAAKAKPKNRFGDIGQIDLTTLPTSLKEISDFGDLS
jgi:hypothetical protein